MKKMFLNKVLIILLSQVLLQASGDAIIGVNLGGWMVLEPWITPSLFYQFLGKKYTPE